MSTKKTERCKPNYLTENEEHQLARLILQEADNRERETRPAPAPLCDLIF